MNTHREAIERVIITGNLEDRPKAREYCTVEGFKIVQDTPRIITANRIEANKFKIVAERPSLA